MLDDSLLSRLISRALRRGAEFADVFCERRHALAYRLQDGKIHDSSYSVTQGVGIRVVTGESAGYAYSDDLSEEALFAAADAASLVARNAPQDEQRSVNLRLTQVPSFYDRDRVTSVEASRYVELLDRADVAARAFDPRVVAVNAHVTDELQEVWIANSTGVYVRDRRPMVVLGVQVVASDGLERG